MPPVRRTCLVLAGLAGLLAPQITWLSEHRLTRPAGNRFLETCRVVADLRRHQSQTNSFVDITAQAGLDFNHVVGPLGTYFMPESTGTGGAMFDYDNDGDLDVYLVNGGRSPLAASDFPVGTRAENRLFRQEADGRFVDVTAESGLGDKGFGVGCAVGDVDNDGDLDVYLTNYGPDCLYQNNGNGSFSDVTEASGISNPDWGTGAVFFDYDRDGWLDLFVTNYLADPIYQHSVACDYGDRGVTYCGPNTFQPTLDRLFHNEGSSSVAGSAGARFTDATARAGLGDTKGAGFSAIAADFDRDGWTDIYVANDLNPNRLWRNGSDGTFRDQSVHRGVAVNANGVAESSMGLGLGDVNGDLILDILATHISGETHTLFMNNTSGLFTDMTRVVKLAASTAPHTGWGVAMLDFDHDRDLDLALANGLVSPCELIAPTGLAQRLVQRHDDITNPEEYWQDYADRNLLFANDGKGVFEDHSEQGGDFTAHAGSARALIHGDIDNDGDSDLLVTYCGGPARLFRNDVAKRGHWLRIRAWDPRWKRDAYGAEVTVVTEEHRILRIVNPASSYLASNDPRPHFGLGTADRYDSIRVVWPDGMVETFPPGRADRLVVLRRGEGE